MMNGCQKCGGSYIPGFILNGEFVFNNRVCKSCILPYRKCTRCGQMTKDKTYEGLCWPCVDKHKKVLKVKPEWKKTYDPKVRSYSPRIVRK